MTRHAEAMVAGVAAKSVTFARSHIGRWTRDIELWLYARHYAGDPETRRWIAETKAAVAAGKYRPEPTDSVGPQPA